MARGLGHVYQRGRIWWIKYYVDGEPRFESSESEHKTAATNLLKKRLGKPKSAVKTGKLVVDDLLNDLLAYYREQRPKSYKTFAVPLVKHLSEALGLYALPKVSPEILKEYREQRMKAGVRPATVNREFALLRKAYNLAREARKIDLEIIPKFRMAPENNTRQGFLEHAQYLKLLEALPEDLKPALVIGYHTGLRRAKVLGLRLDQIDLEHRRILLDPNENMTKKTPMMVPIYGDMVQFIECHVAETRAKLPNCRWFVHRKDGDPVMDLRPAWDNAAKAAGVEGLLFHDLRRSAVRNMVRAGIPEAVAMSISGHKTRSVFERYNIVSGKDLDDAGVKLEQYLGSKK